MNSVLAKTNNKSRYVSTDECRIKSATIYAHPSKIAKMQGLNQPMQQLTPEKIIVTVADNKTVSQNTGQQAKDLRRFLKQVCVDPATTEDRINESIRRYVRCMTSLKKKKSQFPLVYRSSS